MLSITVRSVDHSTSWTQASLSVQLKWSDMDDNSKSAGLFTTLKSLKTGIWQLLRGGFVKMSLQLVSLGFYLLWSEANFCFKIKQSVKGIYTSHTSENYFFFTKDHISLWRHAEVGELKCRTAAFVAPVWGPGQNISQGASPDVNEKKLWNLCMFVRLVTHSS